jgi:hypothetical protein
MAQKQYFENLNSKIVDDVFNSTGFNYESTIDELENGDVNVSFDCPKDAVKFEKLYNEFSKELI